MDELSEKASRKRDAPRGDPEVLAKLGVGKPKRGRRLVVGLVALALVGATAAGVVVLRKRAALERQPSYVTAPVEHGDLRETVTATGTLSPIDAVEVGAEVSGRVTRVLVDVNDSVKKDQLLVELDTEQLLARVDESQAQ